ncbi:C40 family peptidase [Streptosporangiaceae bacterium NEAU-GS5]|nr:C40 family peptidase [Streptosporangiaceae bacterium NEAU-GS5]
MRITYTALVSATLLGPLLAAGPAQAAPVAPGGQGCRPADVVASAATPDGGGYWLAAADGEIFPYGTAPYYGSALGTRLTAPIADLVPTATGGGYWLVEGDGTVLAYGDAARARVGVSPPATERIVSAARVGARGLVLLGADGGVYPVGAAYSVGAGHLGGAGQQGHLGGVGGSTGKSAAAVVGTRRGFWVVTTSGEVISYGDAAPLTSPPLSAPVVDAAAQGADGLLLLTADGRVTPAGGATFGDGEAAGGTSIAVSRDGYWVAGRDGSVTEHGVGFLGDALTRPSICQYALEPVEGAAIAQIATDILGEQAEPGWVGGAVPYSWGGGHKRAPGPSLGTCSGYTGSIRPCPATKTVGLDCSGFARWVYDLAFGQDVFGGVATTGQLARMRKVTAPEPGDLVFFGSSAQRTTHVGVYVGPDQMIEEPFTGATVRLASIRPRKNLVGYYHLAR